MDKNSMHSAVCAECGIECKVPFKPTGEKPVYCSKCFEKKGNSSKNKSYNKSEKFEAICDKCGALCNLPFKPTKGKPVYCHKCFKSEKKSGRKNDRRSGKNIYKNDFARINSKLDKIMELLEDK